MLGSMVVGAIEGAIVGAKVDVSSPTSAQHRPPYPFSPNDRHSLVASPVVESFTAMEPLSLSPPDCVHSVLVQTNRFFFSYLHPLSKASRASYSSCVHKRVPMSRQMVSASPLTISPPQTVSSPLVPQTPSTPRPPVTTSSLQPISAQVFSERRPSGSPASAQQRPP